MLEWSLVVQPRCLCIAAWRDSLNSLSVAIVVINGYPKGMTLLACYACRLIIDTLYKLYPSSSHTCTHMRYACTCSLHAVLSARPSHADSLHALGMVYFDLENYSKAKDMFERVLKLTPTRTDSLYWLARSLVKLGDRKTAAVKLKALLKIDKGNRQARELLKGLEKH